ncbi:hypothetical protein RRG08_014347 [Elysia crispata]|uniref:Ig-like domain-containing protein n=1 Tax=Elysia crispata TaxID=231223 RepID=A0AAE0XP52_9GAST|nr:hypothetical protein RRG08_014347 [Elysia crispata]
MGPRGLLQVTVLVTLLGCTLASDRVPKITMVPEDTRVTEEDKVSLFCRASGEPAPTITWEINGEKINNNADFEISEGPYISSLRIKKARYGDHNKKFTCEAHNKLGNTRAAADVFIYRKKDGPEARRNLCLIRVSDKATEKTSNNSCLLYCKRTTSKNKCSDQSNTIFVSISCVVVLWHESCCSTSAHHDTRVESTATTPTVVCRVLCVRDIQISPRLVKCCLFQIASSASPPDKATPLILECRSGVLAAVYSPGAIHVCDLDLNFGIVCVGRWAADLRRTLQMAPFQP